MSPTTDNFIHSLVEMSKAFEELPNVRAEADERARRAERLAKQVQDREESILRLKAELEAAHEAKRKVEAERDDAEYRFLESEDRTKQALNFIRSTFGSAGSLIQALEPPPPAESVAPAQSEPIPTPPAEQEHRYEPFPTDAMQGHSEPLPTSDHPAPTGTGTESAASGSSSEVPKSDANPPTPTASSTDGDGHSPSTVTPTSTAQPIDDAPSQAQPTTQPYANKRYYDHPTYLTREAWHAGGGTDADYDWRPGRSVGS